jgi:manganese transport protein
MVKGFGKFGNTRGLSMFNGSIRLRKLLMGLSAKKACPGPPLDAFKILKYMGPGLLVTVGFIDPGNWASNLAAGATFGYSLLWIVTLSTIMMIFLQHNAAHLGITTGLCLSEATTHYVKKPYSIALLLSVMGASISTSLAEILGASIALNMLFHIPLRAGAVLVTLFTLIMLLSNTYRVIEKGIIALVSIIGLSFLYELSLVHIDWGQSLFGAVVPAFPQNSMLIIMSVLGAVVMPHNFFLHSEIIQSRHWNLQDEKVVERQLKYEFMDTFVAMLVGWAINCAMIILAAATFFKTGTAVTELDQAQQLLAPLVGSNAALVFAVALLLAGVSSCVTSGMAAGSIYAGIFNEPYNIKDRHTQTGIMISLICAAVLIFLITNPLKALIISQMLLSLQLPFTIFLQIYLTSSEKVMGKYKNGPWLKAFLVSIGVIVTALNIGLFVSLI